MDYKKILREFLKTSTKKSDEEIDSLINESDEAATLSALNELDRARVAKLVEPIAGKQDQFEKSGYKKAMDKLEKAIKSKFDFESDLQGEELVEAIITAKTESSKKSKELTDDDVKRHPVYQGLEKKAKADLKAKEDELTGKITEMETGYKKEAVFSKVADKGLTILDGLKPIFSKNPTVAHNQRIEFTNKLRGFDYEIQDGDRVLMMKDGKVLDDGHGHTMDFESFVKDTASGWFDFEQNNGGSNAGNGQSSKQDGKETQAGGKKGYPNGIIKPKNEKELAAIIQNKEISTEDRRIVMDTWNTELAGGTQNN